MADHVLFVSWGTPVRGREERALEVFEEALGILGRKQQEGRLESFDVQLLTPNGELNGYITCRGTAEQIDALRADEEFQRNTIDAQMCVEGIRHIEGFCDAAIAGRMQMFREALGKVPQRA